MRLNRTLQTLLVLAVCHAPAFAQEKIPSGAKIFIAPMEGFETYVKAALDAKKVPVTLVQTRDQADFELGGAASSEKASTAKKVIMLNWHSKEEASIKVTNVKTGVVVFAYSVHKESSVHGKRSSAEACAKHLGEVVDVR